MNTIDTMQWSCALFAVCPLWPDSRSHNENRAYSHQLLHSAEWALWSIQGEQNAGTHHQPTCSVQCQAATSPSSVSEGECNASFTAMNEAGHAQCLAPDEGPGYSSNPSFSLIIMPNYLLLHISIYIHTCAQSCSGNDDESTDSGKKLGLVSLLLWFSFVIKFMRACHASYSLL